MKDGTSSPTLQKQKIIKEFYEQKLDNLNEMDTFPERQKLPNGLKEKQKI